MAKNFKPRRQRLLAFTTYMCVVGVRLDIAARASPTSD
jgi:hypothetical protein